jgi:predicted ATPase
MAGHGVRLARELAQPLSLVLAVSFASCLQQCRGEPRIAQACAEETIALSVEQGFAHHRATGDLFLGWSKAAQGDLEAGAAAVEQSLATLRALGFNVRRSYYLALLAEICRWSGRFEAGQNAIAEAFAFADESGERWWEADLHRLKGELLLAQSTANCGEAETCFRRAIEIAQGQSARAFELRAATSLARLWAEQGERQKARDLLAPAHGWFTEGFDTADLKEAEALLGELA